MSKTHIHTVRVYYEDTDLSGLVYHANYLKFFERAREHYIGPELLAELFEEEGLGFVVYEASMSFKRGAQLGDELQIRTTVDRESDYRAVFHQSAWLDGEETPLVEADIDLVCIDGDGELVPLPGVIEQTPGE